MARVWLPSVFIKRDKRFILVSILSLALAIGLVNGTLMYLDSTVVGYFDDQLSLVDIDLAFEYDPFKSQEGTLSLTELDAHIKEFYPEVSETVETEILHIEKIDNQSSLVNQEQWHLCGSSNNLFDLFPREFNVTTGNLNLTAHSAVMEENLATRRCPTCKRKAPRMIVVAVAQNNRVCLSQVYAQDAGVTLEDSAGPRIEENTPRSRFQPQGKAMFAQNPGKSGCVFN